MAALTTQTLSRAGVVPSYSSAAGGGDTLVADEGTFLHVKNGGVGSVNVTIAASEGSATTGAIAVAAGAEKMIGPIIEKDFGRSLSKRCNITYSGVSSVTVAVIKLPRR